MRTKVVLRLCSLPLVPPHENRPRRLPRLDGDAPMSARSYWADMFGTDEDRAHWCAFDWPGVMPVGPREPCRTLAIGTRDGKPACGAHLKPYRVVENRPYDDWDDTDDDGGQR